MLFITRRANQSIHIGNDIVITIDRLDGHQVNLGIHAPKDVKILRNELVGTPPVKNRHLARLRARA
jgi:carbon storage regulator